ncbi:hypothetical protein [Labilithrix luteola]|nr:hypothetical protein [Labilithrix luteola]
MITLSTVHANDSSIDTILTLPERTGSLAIARACRETALAFVHESSYWGKAELAMWLMGPYAQLTQYVSNSARRHGTDSPRPVPLLREIDARMVERVVRSARTEVIETMKQTADAEGGASFAFTMMSAGFVVRCEDEGHVPGWVPTTDARRLADRVLSLLAADYLARTSDYENELSVCRHCGAIDFDAGIRDRGICHRHGSGTFAPRSRTPTMPYLPEGA